MKLVTAEQMRTLEKLADQAGHNYESMMELAGRSVASAIRGRVSNDVVILVLVGPGNNGGDGLVAARYLHEWGYGTRVYLWKRAVEDDPNLNLVRQLGLPIAWSHQDSGGALLEEWLGQSDVIVDALLGTGIKGALREDLRALLARVKQRLDAKPPAPSQPFTSLHPWRETAGPSASPPPLVVAVDLPTGLDSDSGALDAAALKADLTVTFAYPKRGHFLFPGAEYVGELLIADIGIDPRLAEGIDSRVATSELVASWLPRRQPSAHKGTFGSTLVVGGSANYVGAPCLAAQAAYRSGAGLVTLAVPSRIYPMAAAKCSEPTFVVLPDDMGVLSPSAWKILANYLEQYQALLIGPGLGQEPPTEELLWDIIIGSERQAARPLGFGAAEPAKRSVKLPPLVLDADALNLLAKRERWWEALPKDTVLTPHPGEMARLTKLDVDTINANRLDIAREYAVQWACTVVLKGAFTVVAAPSGQMMVIPFANPVLATAGTGDVLAGAIVGLRAQGLGGYAAGVCGAFLHALAGNLWSNRLGSAGMLASDLLPLLPEALQRLVKHRGI